MASGMSWFKFAVDAHAHPKLRALTSEEFRMLTYIWSLAAKSSHAGTVRLTCDTGITSHQLASGAGCEMMGDENPDDMLERLATLGLVNVDPKTRIIEVHDWEEHNGRRPSWQPEAKAEQKRKERAGKKNCRTPVAPKSHAGRTEVARVDQEEEKEEDKNKRSAAAPPPDFLDFAAQAFEKATGRKYETTSEDGKHARELVARFSLPDCRDLIDLAVQRWAKDPFHRSRGLTLRVVATDANALRTARPVASAPAAPTVQPCPCGGPCRPWCAKGAA